MQTDVNAFHIELSKATVQHLDAQGKRKSVDTKIPVMIV